jgi:hypothetical protein
MRLEVYKDVGGAGLFLKILKYELITQRDSKWLGQMDEARIYAITLGE